MSNVDFFLINKDTAATQSLALKLAGDHKPGEIIPVTKEEMDAMNYDVVRIAPINNSSDAGLDLVEIDLSKKYILLAKRGKLQNDDVREIERVTRKAIKVIWTN